MQKKMNSKLTKSEKFQINNNEMKSINGGGYTKPRLATKATVDTGGAGAGIEHAFDEIRIYA